MNGLKVGGALFCLGVFACLALPAEPEKTPPAPPLILEAQLGAPVGPLSTLPKIPDWIEPKEISAIQQVQDKQPAKEKLPPAVPTPVDKEKKTPDAKPTEPPQTDIFAQTPNTGGQVLPFFNPNMLGDFSTIFATHQTQTFVTYQTTTKTTNVQGEVGTTTTTSKTTPITHTRTILVSIPTRGAFNIAENESPRPQDRVFFTFNSFSNVQSPQFTPPINNTTSSSHTSSTFQPDFGFTTKSTATSSITNAPGVPSASLNRQVFGFEKTFLDGNASVEMRLPLLQQTGALDSLSGANVGDLTILGKYALYLDRQTGNVFSTGMALTAPTGPGIPTIDGTIRSTLFQPFVGYIWNSNKFFVQAFHSVVLPTDARDVTLLFNDASVNYWLYRGSSSTRYLRFIVPSLEAHVTTPMNHRSGDSPLFIPDLVVMTGGLHLGLFRNAVLTLGAASPVTGPPPFGVEGFLQFNLYY